MPTAPDREGRGREVQTMADDDSADAPTTRFSSGMLAITPEAKTAEDWGLVFSSPQQRVKYLRKIRAAMNCFRLALARESEVATEGATSAVVPSPLARH